MTTSVQALGLPFDEAIAFFRQKANVTSEHWTDVWQKANAKAFTVAGAASRALVEDFRREVAKALEKGTTLQEFRSAFDDIVRRHGWEHTGSPGWRSRIIYETNLSMAYAAGRHMQMTDPGTLAVYPFWQYVHSGSRHPRKDHLSWNGLTLRADDPFWKTHYPPNGWNCGCRVRPLSRRGLQRQGKSRPDPTPEIERLPWANPKTGEVSQVPVGIDPGFDYNPGEAWQELPHLAAPGGGTRQPRSFVTHGEIPSDKAWRAAGGEVVEAGRREGREHLVWTDQDGTILGRTSGTVNRVTLPRDLQMRLSDPAERLVLHHNHPLGSGLSHQDLIEFSLRPGLQQLVAHGHEGQVYAVSRPVEILDGLSREYWRLHQDLRYILREQRVLDRIAPHMEHLLTAALAQRGLFVYGARIDRAAHRLIEKHRSTIEEVLGPIGP